MNYLEAPFFALFFCCVLLSNSILMEGVTVSSNCPERFAHMKSPKNPPATVMLTRIRTKITDMFIQLDLYYLQK